ncbi:Glycosyltransferase like family 2 [Sphingobium faniae]|nr:Glycosyltransferase like family 2 [Sphingobium faniae]
MISPPSAPVWIAVPTFRRPERLRYLLERMAEVVHRDDVALLVAENDVKGQEGAAVAQAMAADGYPLPLHVLIVERPGLCAVRNAIAAAAMADPAMRMLALIDDDEWPQPGWLDALLACQAETGAEAVGGPVDPHFAAPPPRWVEETLVFRAEERTEGMTSMLWASNNLLLTRKALERVAPPWFDMRFNRSGGEDLDFLMRLRAAGATFGWSPRARVSEWVPPERVRLSWVLRRMERIGCTETLARRKQRPGFGGGLALFARSVALLGLRTAGLAGMLLPGARRVDIAGQWVKCWGRLHAFAGGSQTLYGSD